MQKRFLFLLLLLLYANSAGAWKPFVRDVPLNETGSPLRVNDLMMDVRGYLWLATDDGLLRYNGRSFIAIADSQQALVTTLACAGSGLWLGYSDGSVGWCDEQGVTPVHHGNAPADAAVSDMIVTSWGLIRSTRGNGLYLRMAGVELHFGMAEGLPDDFVYDLEWDADRKGLLAATDQGIALLKPGEGGKVEVQVLDEEVPEGYDRITRCLGVMALPGNRSVVFKGAQEGGVWLLLRDDKGRVLYSRPAMANWHFGQVNDLQRGGNNRFLAGTEDGMLIQLSCTVQGDSLQLQEEQVETSGRKIQKILTDRTGTVWLATSQGLTALALNYLEYLPLGNGYNLRSVFAVCGDRAGNKWYSQNHDLWQYDERSGEPRLRYTAPATITALYNDSSDRMWIGTLGKGLICLGPEGQVVPVTNIPSLANGHILSVTGAGHHLWVSSLNGVDELLVEPGAEPDVVLLQHHSKHSGIGSDYVYRLYADRRNRIWMATDGSGVCMYDGYNYHHWDSSSGFQSKVVYTITEDARGHIWAGTLEHGLYRYDGRRWTITGDPQGLEDRNIATVAANATGEVVVVGHNGVNIWQPFNRSFRSFNRRTGIHLDTVSEALNCASTDLSGQVFLPFEHGLLLVRNVTDTTDIRPRVVLAAAELFSRPQPLSRHSYGSNENYLSFRFDGIAYANPERLRYRYMLEGYNDGWITTSDESVSFPKLRPGRYRFKVQASLQNSFAGAATASYDFFIEAPVWRRAWFIALVVACILGIVFGYVRLREKSLRKLGLLQRERMIFEYEHLKSQVNPHFLFNSLNTLVSLIEEDRKAAVDYTVQLSDLYRNMLAHRDRDLILLSEEWAILSKYLYIQKSRFGKALQLNTNLTEAQMQDSRIVPLALQLLVENAIKHNIVSRSKPLVITIRAEGDTLYIRNTLQEKPVKEQGAGLGLENIRNRYALITKRPVGFGIQDHEFVVTLPLL